jgi:hypothetical protein
MQRLQAMQLPKVLGIEIFNVMVTSIKATDTGSDVLAQQQMSEFTRVRDWQLDSAIVQGTQITPQWMMINRPDIYAQLMAGNFQVVKELIDKGLLDPAAFLNQASGAPSFDPSKLLSGFGSQGLPGQFGGNTGMPMIAEQSSMEKDINTRIREEVNYLKKLPGANVENKPGQDDDGVPDGSFDLRITMPRASGGTITIYITCPKGFPVNPPTIDAEVDGEDAPFQPAVLRRWSGQYLVEIVREAKQYFG